MIDESNPAGRLHKILSEVARKNGDGIRIGDVWASALGCSANDQAEITRRLVEVYGLCEEVKNLIKFNPDLNHDLYLASFPKIERAILPAHLGQQWKNIRPNLDGEVLARLQFCTEALQNYYAEESIADDELTEIKELVHSLSNVVVDSAIPAELKLALLEELDRIRKAIELVKIKGAKGVKEALQGLVGAVVANQDGLHDLKISEPGVLQRLGKLLDKLDAFTAKALKVKRILSGPVRYVLTRITDPEDEQEEASDV